MTSSSSLSTVHADVATVTALGARTDPLPPPAPAIEMRPVVHQDRPTKPIDVPLRDGRHHLPCIMDSVKEEAVRGQAVQKRAHGDMKMIST